MGGKEPKSVLFTYNHYTNKLDMMIAVMRRTSTWKYCDSNLRRFEEKKSRFDEPNRPFITN